MNKYSCLRLPIVVKMLLIALLQGCVSVNNRHEDPEKAAQIYSDLGLDYLRKGKLDLALVKLQRSLELDPGQPEANHYIAEVYRQMGETKSAEEYFEKALDYDTDNPMLLNNYGAFLCNQGRIEKAEKYFVRAANVPDYRTPELAYENLALCAMQNKDKVKAEEYFRKALELQPALPKSLYQMALLSYEQGQYLHAGAFIQRFHSIGRTEKSLNLAIRIEQALGDQDAVATLKEKLKKEYPDTKPE